MIKKVFILVTTLFTVLVLAACGLTGGNDVFPQEDEITSYIEMESVSLATESEQDAHTHSYVKMIALESTCTSIGKEVMKCACGDIESETYLPIAPHNANPASCGIDSICKICGMILVKQYEHIIAYTTVTEVSCASDGLKTGICHRCGYIESIVTPSSHIIKKLIVVEDELQGVCTLCGQTISNNNVSYWLKARDSKDITFKTDYKYYFPAKFSRSSSPYQLEFTLTFNGFSDVLKANNKGILRYQTYNHSILRQFTISDERGGYRTDMVDVKDPSGAPHITTMQKGEPIKFTFWVDPAKRSIDIYVNDGYVTTRTISDASCNLAMEPGLNFGHGQLNGEYTISGLSIIRPSDAE